MPQHLGLVRAAARLERRMFLKALALGLSLPAALRLARTATAATGSAPKRFFLFYMPHGVPVEHYNPRVSESDRTSFDLDKTNLSILGPLQKYKSQVNVYQGFKYPGGASHDGLINCLSGLPGNPEDVTPRTTLEHVIAKGLGVKPLILGACSHIATNFDRNGKLFWNGTAVEPQKSPVAAADGLFGGASSTPTTNVDAELRKDLLALTATEIQSLQGTLGDLTGEKTKLQRHLEAIQGIQNGGSSSGQSSCSGAPNLPTVAQVRAASAGQVIDSSGGNDYFYQEANFQLLLKAQLEVAAQAIVCNAAQVTALMPMFASCDFDFSFTKKADAPAGGWSHHAGLSHTGFQPAPGAQYDSPLSVDNFNASTRAAFGNAQRWFADQLDTYLLQALANTDDPADPGKKVLDNTLVYWMSEIGDCSNHTTASMIEYPQVPSYLPLVSIGSAGGALKSGQVVRFETDRPAGDLYLTFCQAMGVTGASFPDATGPVTEVLA